MGAGEKIRNQTEKLTAAVKQRVGRATGDRELELKGRLQMAKADLKQVAEKAKDVFRR
jgi:uncharacterized protein YjbJ (UPF0337 family)